MWKNVDLMKQQHWEVFFWLIASHYLITQDELYLEWKCVDFDSSTTPHYVVPLFYCQLLPLKGELAKVKNHLQMPFLLKEIFYDLCMTLGKKICFVQFNA